MAWFVTLVKRHSKERLQDVQQKTKTKKLLGSLGTEVVVKDQSGMVNIV